MVIYLPLLDRRVLWTTTRPCSQVCTTSTTRLWTSRMHVPTLDIHSPCIWLAWIAPNWRRTRSTENNKNRISQWFLGQSFLLVQQTRKRTYHANEWSCIQPAEFPEAHRIVSNHFFDAVVESIDAKRPRNRHTLEEDEEKQAKAADRVRVKYLEDIHSALELWDTPKYEITFSISTHNTRGASIN